MAKMCSLFCSPARKMKLRKTRKARKKFLFISFFFFFFCFVGRHSGRSIIELIHFSSRINDNQGEQEKEKEKNSSLCSRTMKRIFFPRNGKRRTKHPFSPAPTTTRRRRRNEGGDEGGRICSIELKMKYSLFSPRLVSSRLPDEEEEELI